MAYGYDNVLGNINNGYSVGSTNNDPNELARLRAELEQLKNGNKPQQPISQQLQTATILEYKNSDRYHILIGKYIKPLLDMPMVSQILSQVGFKQQYDALASDVQRDYLTYEQEVKARNEAASKVAENNEIAELKAQMAQMAALLKGQNGNNIGNGNVNKPVQQGQVQQPMQPQNSQVIQQAVQQGVQQGITQFPQTNNNQMANNGGILNNRGNG